MTNGTSTLRLGTAPDSWGVWFPQEPRQVPWHRFLDEVAAAGYRWVELGPYGYLPRDPARLRAELRQRGLSLSGGCFGGDLSDPGAFDAISRELDGVAALTKELGGEYLVCLPPMGERVLDDREWASLVGGLNRLGSIAVERFGLELAFHHHADSYVETQAQTERLLEETDARTVKLCLDTGHLSYYGGDSLAIVRRFPERIACLHVKQVAPAILQQVRAERLDFPAAVARRVMCEPPTGEPDLAPILDAAGALAAGLFVIVEQDLFPCEPDEPLPIARRTHAYLTAQGLVREPESTLPA